MRDQDAGAVVAPFGQHTRVVGGTMDLRASVGDAVVAVARRSRATATTSRVAASIMICMVVDYR